MKDNKRPFADPEFLQALGRVTISFALLDGTLTALLNMIDASMTVQAVARMDYSRKVERYIMVAKTEIEKAGGHPPFTPQFFSELKCELKDVSAKRNSLIHDFWTIEFKRERMVLKGLKDNQPPVPYPTPAMMMKLSDRIYAVRSAICPIIGVWTTLLGQRARADRAALESLENSGG